MEKIGARTAFISDVHGNSPALEAVLSDIAKHEVDELINLGDTINGMDPQGCAQLLRDWAIRHHVQLTCVMGNAEAYLVTPNREELFHYGVEYYPGLLELIHWYEEQLSEDVLAWIRTWPMTLRWRDAILVHDSPLDRIKVQTESDPIIQPKHREWFFHGRGIFMNDSDEEFQQQFDWMDHNHCERVFCGHTHEAFLRTREGRLICNVGSAGAPLDGDWRPSWVLLEVDESGAEHLMIQRVEYDLSCIHQLVDATPEYPSFVEDPKKMEAFKRWYATGIHWRYHLNAIHAGDDMV